MAFIMPSELLHTFVAKTISTTATFAAQQGDNGRSVTMEDVIDTMKTMLNDANYLDDTLGAAWMAPLVALEEMMPEYSDVGHTHPPSLIGLGDVANLSPLDLPISTPQAEALALKVDGPSTDVGASEWVLTVPAEW